MKKSLSRADIQSPNRRPLRIAFLTSQPASAGSGCERLIYNTASALISRGHDARVYVMDAHLDGMPPFFSRQLPVLPFEKTIESYFAKKTGFNDLLFPSSLLLCFNPFLGLADIWHFHNLHGHYVSIPLLGLISWWKRVVISPVDQYLSTGHCPYPMECKKYLYGCGACPRIDEPWPGISRDSTRFLYRIKQFSFGLSRIKMLFHTKALADHYKKTFIRHRSIQVIKYGTDIHCYRPLARADCARRLGVRPGKRFVVGLLHSLLIQPRKGIIPIVRKLSKLENQFPRKIELLVVGHGSEVVRDIVPSKIPVTVLPFFHHAHDLANALNMCDVLLYPTHAENMSLTCLNALSCGVPVISYNAGGQKEAIINGVNGYIVDIDDQDGMMNALLEIINKPRLHKKLSKGARETAEKKFDFDRYIEDLIKYYYKIL